MPRKTLSGVKSGFDNLPNGKWFPVSIAKAYTRFGKPGTKWEHVLQLGLEYSISEEMHGVKAGRKAFDSGALEGENAGMTRARLEQIRPDLDWGDFEFPEPHESQAELENELVGQDGYILTKHTTDRNDASKVYVNIAKYQQEAPPELEGEEFDDDDDEEYEDDDEEDEEDDDTDE